MGRRYDRDNKLIKVKEQISQGPKDVKKERRENKEKLSFSQSSDSKSDPKWNRNIPIEEAICFKCQSKGHLARNCTETRPKTVYQSTNDRKDAKENDKIVQIVLQTKEPELGLPVIDVELPNFEKTVSTLIDSGAQTSVLSEKIIPPDILIKPMAKEIRLVGLASETKPLGSIDLIVKIGPIVTKLRDVPVLRNTAFDLILGADWRSTANVNVTTLQNGDVRIDTTKEITYLNIGYCFLSRKICEKVKYLNENKDRREFEENETEIFEQTNKTYNSDDIEKESEVKIFEQAEKKKFVEKELLLKIEETVENCDMATEVQKEKFRDLLLEYSDVFTTKDNDLGFCDYIEHPIRLKDDIPVRFKPYRFSETEKEFIETKCLEWESKGIIRKSHSEYASPAFVVEQPNHPSTPKRLVVNYRALNSKIKFEQSAMPTIEDEINLMTRKQPVIFSCADVKTAFLNVPIIEGDKHKTAFITHNQLWECNRMMFGLSNAPQTMQRIMNDTYREIEDTAVYMDDIGSGAKDVDQMLQKTEALLKATHSRGLRFDLAQCQFLKTEIDFLGYLIDAEGRRPNPKRLEAVDRFQKFECVKDVRSFLGFASFYRMYVPNFSRLAKPLNTLLKKNTEFQWEKEHDDVVQEIKSKLKANLKLGHFDSESTTYVTVDASYKGLGAVLTQEQTGKEVTIMFASRSLNEREEKLHSNDLEMMAVHWAVTDKFRIYLYGLSKPFIVMTDNWTVTCLMDRHLMNRKFARWIIDLQEYRFEVRHKPGKRNQVADGLSRCVNIITEKAVTERYAYVILRALNDKLKTSQAEDNFCAGIFSKLDSNDDFEIVDGILTRIVLIKNKKTNRIVVPSELRAGLLKQHHDDEGHMNGERTTSKIARQYWWPKMYHEISEYVQSCEACQKNNHRTTKRYGLMQKWEIPEEKFSVISVDYIGPLPRFQGYTHIIVSVDHTTRYVNARPQRNPTTNQIVNFLKEEIIFRHRTPCMIVSDNAKPFVSTKMVDFLKDHNIERINSPPYWAESNGLIERTVGTVTRAIRKSISKETMWKEKLPEIVFAINTSRHSALKMTPFELVYASKPITKAEIEIGYLLEETKDEEDEMQEKRKQAHENLRKSQEKEKQRYDETKREHNFKLGDKVLLEKEARGKKFEELYTGPYRISKRISENIFQIEPMDDIDQPKRVVPAQRLKNYHDRK